MYHGVEAPAAVNVKDKIANDLASACMELCPFPACVVDVVENLRNKISEYKIDFETT